MKKIGFLFTEGRKSRIIEVEKGTAPSEFFYGALLLQKKGYAVELLEAKDISPLDSAAALKRLNSFDALVATTNFYVMALGQLKRRGLLKPAVIAIAMAIFRRGFHPLLKYKLNKLFGNLIIVSTGKAETNFFKQNFSAHASRIHYLPFGVDASFWHPSAVSRQLSAVPYIFSIGNDRSRDWGTLIKAWKKEYPLLKIITKRKIDEKIPANVEISKGDWRTALFSDQEIRTLMQESLFGIIPIKNIIQPGGQSSALQMMACAKAVIISNNEGLWDKELMKHQETCLLVEPGSITDLQKNIERLLKNKNLRQTIGASARQVIASHLNAENMARAISDLLDQID